MPPKIKTQTRKKKRERASKGERGASIDVDRFKHFPLKRPDGELGMLLKAMKEAELQSQVQAETATKLRHRIVQIIRARRLAGNVAIEVMAAAIGRNRVSMVRVERGSSVAKDSTLAKMLAFIGVEWEPTAKIFTSQAKIQQRRAE